MLLGFKAAVCKITGDWAEFAKIWGFVSWSVLGHPCFLCHCTRGDMLSLLRDCNALEMHWPLADMDSYNLACAKREIKTVLNADQGRRVVAALYQDRRKDGSRGRALMWDLTDLGLAEGDRLEPSPEVPDPGALELSSK